MLDSQFSPHTGPKVPVPVPVHPQVIIFSHLDIHTKTRKPKPAPSLSVLCLLAFCVSCSCFILCSYAHTLTHARTALTYSSPHLVPFFFLSSLLLLFSSLPLASAPSCPPLNPSLTTTHSHFPPPPPPLPTCFFSWFCCQLRALCVIKQRASFRTQVWLCFVCVCVRVRGQLGFPSFYCRIPLPA